jgi:HEAT repeat protein
VRLLGDPDRGVRLAAREALDEIGTEREIPSV